MDELLGTGSLFPPRNEKGPLRLSMSPPTPEWRVYIMMRLVVLMTRLRFRPGLQKSVSMRLMTVVIAMDFVEMCPAVQVTMKKTLSLTRLMGYVNLRRVFMFMVTFPLLRNFRNGEKTRL